MHCDDSRRRPLWQDALPLAVPILVGEACVAVRDWIRREHKARIRARERASSAN